MAKQRSQPIAFPSAICETYNSCPGPLVQTPVTLSAVLCVKSQLLNNKTIVYVVSVCLTDMCPEFPSIFESLRVVIKIAKKKKKKPTKSGRPEGPILRLSDNASSYVAPSEPS